MSEEPQNTTSQKNIAIVVAIILAVGAIAFFLLTPNNQEVTTSAPEETISVEAAPTQTADTTTSSNEPAPSAPAAANDTSLIVGNSAPLPSYVEGEPYSKTEEGIKQWQPLYTAFLEGIRTDGNLAEAIGAENMLPSVAEQLSSVPDGAYKGFTLSSAEQVIKEEAEPFSYSQTLQGDDGTVVTVTIAYVWDGENPGSWKIAEVDFESPEQQ